MHCFLAMIGLISSGWRQFSFAFIPAFGLALASYPESTIRNPTNKEVSAYDFIVIGAGSAGSVVANRLSEEKNWNVLLLEAGGHETEFTDIPYYAGVLQDSQYDWKYRSEPPQGNQSYCLAMVDHVCKYARGKVLGGSSVINNNLYVRGNKLDYDHWEEIGNTGWGYEDVLKYFVKSENNSNPELRQTRFHGSDGYLSVQDITTTPVANVIVKGGEHLGYEHRLDSNLDNQTGFAIPQGTIRHGSRCSTAKAFINPIVNRRNLHISTHSFVTKIHFNHAGHKPKATGVSFIKNNQTYTVKASKEVVLCAGAISSPQILMLSGVGPESHLKEFGIKNVKDLKVGYNHQNHISALLDLKVTQPIVDLPSEVHSPITLKQYLEKREGTLTMLGGLEAVAFINTKYAPESGSYPDIELSFQENSIYSSGKKDIGFSEFNLRPGLFNGTRYTTLANDRLFYIQVIQIRPQSKGRIKLKSSDPFVHPLIDPNSFAVQQDMDVLVEGMQAALKLAKTPPFKEAGITPLDMHFPGCENYELYSNDYFDCYARHFTYHLRHSVGTCAMGVGEDAVVDPRLKVHGVDSLRVVDASVMPFISSANTHASVIMIGEKGADLIKEDWLYSSKN